MASNKLLIFLVIFIQKQIIFTIEFNNDIDQKGLVDPNGDGCPNPPVKPPIGGIPPICCNPPASPDDIGPPNPDDSPPTGDIPGGIPPKGGIPPTEL